MTKQQYLVIASALCLFLVLYLGCDTKNKNAKMIERSNTLNSSTASVNADALIQQAKDTLPANLASQLKTLENQLTLTNTDSATVNILKEIAHFWYEAGNPAISGKYAFDIAGMQNTEDAWLTAGSTFYIGIQAAKDAVLRQFCSENAIKAIENAISINPSIENKVNLALCYVENPPQDNPMKGVLMLRELDTQNPNNVAVLFQLGRLAIKTGQYAKAVDRLEKVISLQPNNKKAYCLLAEAYIGLNNTAAAQKAQQQCQ